MKTVQKMVLQIAFSTRIAANRFSSSWTFYQSFQRTSFFARSIVHEGRYYRLKESLDGRKWIHTLTPLRYQNESRKPQKGPLFTEDRLLRVLQRGIKPPSEPLPFRPDGFVRFNQLLEHLSLCKDTTKKDLMELVETTYPRKFQFRIEPEIVGREKVNTLWIRAFSGHTIPGIDGRYRRIKPSYEIGKAYYRSTEKQWKVIKNYGIVQSGNQNYIQLFKEPRILKDHLLKLTVESKRTIIVEVDVKAAMEEGIAFYFTQDGDIVTEGDSEYGRIPPHHIKSATAYAMTMEYLR